jgi:hypothetical protein
MYRHIWRSFSTCPWDLPVLLISLFFFFRKATCLRTTLLMCQIIRISKWLDVKLKKFCYICTHRNDQAKFHVGLNLVLQSIKKKIITHFFKHVFKYTCPVIIWNAHINSNRLRCIYFNATGPDHNNEWPQVIKKPVSS